MHTLTAKQAEVLKGIRAVGGIALHLQTGRTQAVVRNLIKKGAALIAKDGRVVAVDSGPKHFTHADIAEAARPIPDSTWRRAVVTLKDGDTIDSPYSTKWYFTGAGAYTFLVHPTSVELTEAPDSVRRTYAKASRGEMNK